MNSHVNFTVLMVYKFSVFGLLSLMACSAQSAPPVPKIILPDSKMTDSERQQFEKRLREFNQRNKEMEPLYLKSAKMATEKLCAESLKGNFNYAIENIYPRYKRKQVMLAGGEDRLLRKFQDSINMLRKDGTVIMDIKVGEPIAIRDVHMEKKEGLRKVYYPMDFTFQKLVIVPTSMVLQFAVIDKGTGKPTRVEKNNCQLALYDGKTKAWSFIDGSTISKNELMGLFPGFC